MSQGILDVKLCELDEEVGKLHSRILQCEQLSDNRLREEIALLRFEVQDQGRKGLTSLYHTKAALAEELVEKFKLLQEEMQQMEREYAGSELAILSAEYDIDFAILAAKHALLKAMEAVAAERTQERKEVNA